MDALEQWPAKRWRDSRRQGLPDSFVLELPPGKTYE